MAVPPTSKCEGWLLAILVSCVLPVCVRAAFTFESSGQDSLTVLVDGIQVISHTPDSPFLFVGSGQASFRSYHGNFRIEDFVSERVALRNVTVLHETEGSMRATFHRDGLLGTTVAFDQGNLSLSDVITFGALPEGVDRVWLRLHAEGAEHVYGGGEQFSHFDLRGRAFPMWIQEQGVGRNKSTEVTFKADGQDWGGGDYHTTYWAQPTFTSSRRYVCHLDTTGYSELDFRAAGFHELLVWGRRPPRLYLAAADSFPALLGKLTGFLGRQPPLPSWTHDGAILGVQGGTAKMLDYLKQAQENSIVVNGLWIQDWVGRIKTSFGSRLFWDWVWDREHYPGLDEEIVRLRARGVRVFGYINPNLNREGTLFPQAEAAGFLVRNGSGDTYLVDYGEFLCGIVDMTNPAAFDWYKGVIKRNMVDLGLAGWMADFGEYLPTDAAFHGGQDARDLHNAWPVLWARLNREVAEEAGLVGELLIWMRAGYTGSQAEVLVTWAGDQLVDFSLADGLASVVPAALSLGMSGHGLTHFDVGGFTSLFGVVRSEELLLRYAELAAFTPLMRTHEGNRPDLNWQFYTTPATSRALGRHTKIFQMLGDYARAVVKENAANGLPAQRPLFMHYSTDARSFEIQYEYLYGRDLLVAPVYKEGVDSWPVYLPPDDWVFFWDGSEHQGGDTVSVPAPLGKIPVFYRKESSWASHFKKIAEDNFVSSHEGGLPRPQMWTIVTAVIISLLFFWSFAVPRPAQTGNVSQERRS